MKRTLLSLLLLGLISTLAIAQPPDKPPAGDTTENSLDWNGTYSAVLPCADCEGIETELTLNSDYTFVIRRSYLGKPGKVFTKSGAFQFVGNGSTVLLDKVQGPARYFIGEGYAKQLDLSGAPIRGPLAKRYTLRKQ